jgi:hypothetical protein
MQCAVQSVPPGVKGFLATLGCHRTDNSAITVAVGWRTLRACRHDPICGSGAWGASPRPAAKISESRHPYVLG